VYTARVIISFGDRTTEDIYHGHNTRLARRVPKEIWRRVQEKLDLLDASRTMDDLRIPPANRLEKLRGNWTGFYSIRVNQQCRIVFRFERGNCSQVRCADYH
jgi:proteic killer suppression protein